MRVLFFNHFWDGPAKKYIASGGGWRVTGWETDGCFPATTLYWRVKLRLPAGGEAWHTSRMKLFLTLMLLLTGTVFAEKKVIAPPGTPAGRPFSPAILSGGTLYVSGMVGNDKQGNYPEKFEDEVKQCLENIEGVLKAGGYSLADAVAVQVYLTDMDLFQNMNKVYMSMVPEPRPTRTTVGVAKLVGKARIEITVTARK
jgi:2-iminobutanoate/2-iminopropanoate deaminase